MRFLLKAPQNLVEKEQGEWNFISCYIRVSHSVISNSLQLPGPWPTRLFCPWNSLGKNTGVGFHFLLQDKLLNILPL